MKNNFWVKYFLHLLGIGAKPPSDDEYEFKCGDIVRHKLLPENKMIVVNLLYDFDFNTISYIAYGYECVYLTLNKDYEPDFKLIEFYEDELERWSD